MNTELLEKIDKKIEERTATLISETIKFVNIKSVESSPEPGAPFGAGCKRVLSEFINTAEAADLYTADYDVGVVSASMYDGTPDLGIWLHGDVVPEGDGWRYDPYDAVEYRGCVIGRGATDNKGQLVSVIELFKIFKELGIKLNYNPAIYLGSNEETGMADLVGDPEREGAVGFLNVAQPPRMSLVPDGGFPVGYGGKGGLNIKLRSTAPFLGFTFIAGSDTAPGLAAAKFDTPLDVDAPADCKVVSEWDCTEISAYSPPRHGASPDPDGNMITMLSRGLLSVCELPHDARRTLGFFAEVSADIYGETFGISTTHDVMGRLTVFSKAVSMDDGHPVLHLNIRYPLGITYEEIVEKIGKVAAERGFEVCYSKAGIKPYMLDPTSQTVTLLYEAASSVTGSDKKPYTMSGGTYAHRLPNAYVFGMDGNLPPDDFSKGRGGAHGVDEAVSIDRLKRAMRIYARALLRLDENGF